MSLLLSNCCLNKVPSVNYRWSKTYRMSRKGINYTSLQGDTFYIVRLKRTGNIAVAYNTKFFEYTGKSEGTG